MRYRLRNAWPSKVEITGMKVGGTEVVIQTVTIVAESIDLMS